MSNFSSMSKTELVKILKKIEKRCSKVEKLSKAKKSKSPTFCGNPSNRKSGLRQGNSLECLKKGVGTGKYMGMVKGINQERKKILDLLEK